MINSDNTNEKIYNDENSSYNMYRLQLEDNNSHLTTKKFKPI